MHNYALLSAIFEIFEIYKKIQNAKKIIQCDTCDHNYKDVPCSGIARSFSSGGTGRLAVLGGGGGGGAQGDDFFSLSIIKIFLFFLGGGAPWGSLGIFGMCPHMIPPPPQSYAPGTFICYSKLLKQSMMRKGTCGIYQICIVYSIWLMTSMVIRLQFFFLHCVLHMIDDIHGY